MFNVTVNVENNIGNTKGYIYEVTLKNLLISGFLANSIYKKIETNIAGEIEYFDEDMNGFTTITDETNFYINENGNPVVVFDKYEIAPGAYGEQEFEIVK